MTITILLVLACSGAAITILVLAHRRYRVFDANVWERLQARRSHLLSRALGKIDYACIDRAPGWWDFDVDCAGHRCGTCLVCHDRPRRRS